MHKCIIMESPDSQKHIEDTEQYTVIPRFLRVLASSTTREKGKSGSPPPPPNYFSISSVFFFPLQKLCDGELLLFFPSAP
jgi:hypothetical protein